MSDPAVRRIVVGVDGSAESAAAFRWACREASLREAEVHAVHVSEGGCHSLASYAVPGYLSEDEDESVDFVQQMWQSVVPEQASGLQIRTEVVEGLAARVLLDRCAGADMLVLGTAGDTPGALRSPGPVLRACVRRAPCPVVVISVAQDPLADRESASVAALDDVAQAVATAVGSGTAVPAGAYVLQPPRACG
jgi:nucleotide-binding universal stress UspA family protein